MCLVILRILIILFSMISPHNSNIAIKITPQKIKLENKIRE